MSVDKPNVVLPLAASINTRGVAAATNSFTNALDQRKINSIYEPIRNPLTDKTTLYLCKRPGVADAGQTYGTSGQKAYLVRRRPSGTDAGNPANYWVFSVSGNDIRASNSGGTTTVIVTAAGYAPVYADLTVISGTETLVLQIRNGSGAQRAFYSSAIATFTEISDGDFTGLTHRGKIEHLDGFAFIMDASNDIWNSDLNSVSSWPATGRIKKQMTQDNPIGLAQLGKQILAFGEETMEVFVNHGNPGGSPLMPVQELWQRIGMPDVIGDGINVSNYYAVLDGRLYFISGLQSLYAWNGSRMEKVSNPAVDKIIRSSGAFFSITAFRFAGKKAIAISLTNQDATTQRWLMFFPDWNDWFEWTSTVFTPREATEYLHLGVGSNQHKLYALSEASDNWQDAGSNFDRVHQFKWPANGNELKFMSMFGLKQEQERSACTESVSYSDDDGQNWSAVRTIDCTSDKPQLYRMGSFRNRVFRLTNSSNHERRMEAVVARVT